MGRPTGLRRSQSVRHPEACRSAGRLTSHPHSPDTATATLAQIETFIAQTFARSSPEDHTRPKLTVLNRHRQPAIDLNAALLDGRAARSVGWDVMPSPVLPEELERQDAGVQMRLGLRLFRVWEAHLEAHQSRAQAAPSPLAMDDGEEDGDGAMATWLERVGAGGAPWGALPRRAGLGAGNGGAG